MILLMLPKIQEMDMSSGLGMTTHISSTIVKQLDDSCAKRRKIILDGSAAASMQQMFAPETSSYLTIVEGSYL